mgnify:CR=1 FL=1
MATALAFVPPSPLASEVSTTLNISAGAAFEVFADAVEIPRWLPLVQTARVLKLHQDGRPARVAPRRARNDGRRHREGRARWPRHRPDVDLVNRWLWRYFSGGEQSQKASESSSQQASCTSMMLQISSAV